jgi:hypothetical protein
MGQNLPSAPGHFATATRRRLGSVPAKFTIFRVGLSAFDPPQVEPRAHQRAGIPLQSCSLPSKNVIVTKLLAPPHE